MLSATKKLQLIQYLKTINQYDKYLCNILQDTNIEPDTILNDYYKDCKTLKTSTYLTAIHDFSFTDTIEIGGLTHIIFSSNPCIFKTSDGTYKMNIRMINYYMDENVNRLYHTDKSFSINKVLTLSNDLMTVDNSHYFKLKNPKLERHNNGVEDLKVISSSLSCNNLAFIGSMQVSNNNENIGIVIGVYDVSKDYLEPIHICSPFNRIKEKNWVFFGDKIVYEWFPLSIASLSSDGLLEILDTIPSNPFFRNIRGSSNGCFVKNKDTGLDEIWFLCHAVNIENIPRHYYHCFVILENENDTQKIRIKKWSVLFKFEGCRIEFSLGMIVEDTRILISYSTWDKTSKIMILDREGVEKDLICF